MPFTPQPLSERVYLALRRAILTGEVRDRLVESQLAQQLQVSRTPIREAIRRLQQEQLLTSDSAGGVSIAEISQSSALHLYDCRITLEQLAVTGACRHATAQQIDALRQNLREADWAAQGKSVTASLQRRDLNYEFHQLIALSSQNPWLVSLLDQLANQVKLLRLQILQVPVDVEAIQIEHWDIVEAIAQRDEITARKTMRLHLERSQRRVQQTFARRSPAPSPQILCPSCQSPRLRKNGRRQNRQNYLCKQCGRQFIYPRLEGPRLEGPRLEGPSL